MRKLLIAFAALAATTVAGYCGPFVDAEEALQSVYADYRSALFMTNMNKAEESEKAILSLRDKWTALSDQWTAAAPPQYADDPKLAETLAAVSAIAAKADNALKAGKMPEAHEILEGIRGQISGLHERAGIISLSDRMNDYHGVMEEVLAVDLTKIDDKAMADLTSKAAVLSYLSGQLMSHPPVEVGDTPEFAQLAKAVTDTSAAFLTAAQSKDAASMKTAVGALKPAYSKFFLKFG